MHNQCWKPKANQVRRVILAVVLAAPALTGSGATLYVWQNSPSSTPPHATWTTAATSIQDAIDVATAGDEIVVTNGIYATGGHGVFGTTARIAVEKAIRVRSVNGPGVTVIEGAPSADSTFFGLGPAAVRCAYLGQGAQLSGFTLTNGYTSIGHNGGGALCETSALLTNCVLINNRSGDPDNDSSGGGIYQGILDHCWLIGNVCHGEGGGAASSTLFNCMVTGNISGDGGGGVAGGTLHNCVLSGNRSSFLGGGAFHAAMYQCTIVSNSLTSISGGEGAGTYGGTLYNCIAYHNGPEGNHSLSTLNFSCTTPLPVDGFGNLTNEPAFVNAGTGDYRLRPGSPCIDAGTNLTGIVTHDLGGTPRPLDGNRDGIAAFDMGAYEFNPLFFTSITKVGSNVQLCWFDSPAGMQLQAAASLHNPGWTNVPFAPGTNCQEWPLGSDNRFFRLVLP